MFSVVTETLAPASKKSSLVGEDGEKAMLFPPETLIGYCVTEETMTVSGWVMFTWIGKVPFAARVIAIGELCPMV